MCSCEPSFTCARCAGTPADDRYLDDHADELPRDRALNPPTQYLSRDDDTRA